MARALALQPKVARDCGLPVVTRQPGFWQPLRSFRPRASQLLALQGPPWGLWGWLKALDWWLMAVEVWLKAG